MTISGFDHVALPTQRPEEMIEFYASLGFEVPDLEEWRKSAVPFFSVSCGSQKINFHAPAMWQNPDFRLRGPASAPGCGDLCFVWEGDSRSLERMLERAGAAVIAGPVDLPGGRGRGTSVYVRDPDENLLEFIVYGPSAAESKLRASAEIAARINEWAFHRDQGRWDELLGSFHEGGTISLSWYDGSYEGFVAASKQLAASGNALVKHRLGVPRIRVRGDRALSEVDVTIMLRARTQGMELDTTSYARFYDRLERREGEWRMRTRTAIYEKDRADPVSAPSLPADFFAGLDRFPAAVRFLAASLERVGAKLSESLVLDGSQRLGELYREGEAWLAGGGS